MAAVTQNASSSWNIEQPIELETAVARIVAEIIMTTLLTGIDDHDFKQLASDIPDFVREVTTFGPLDFLPIPDTAIDRLRGLGRSEQEARLRALASRLAQIRSEPPDAIQDIPALLRGVGPLADNILGIMPAGSDTTARAAAWAIYLLALYPEWQDAVREEAQSAATRQVNSDELPIARQVAQETLRLYPPAPILVRVAMKPASIGGFQLRSGQAAIIAVYAVHRHNRLWEEPDMFDPDRFGPDASYNRSAFLPFGMGPRLCIAASFALTEISVIMSELVKKYRFTTTGPDPEVSLKITTHSLTGLHVKAEPV